MLNQSIKTEKQMALNKYAMIALMTAMIVLVSVGVFEFTYEAAPTIFNTTGHSGLHEWTCDGQPFDLLIDDESVKLGPKLFSPREIVQLQTLNGDSEISTFDIFVQIDEKTKSCLFEFGSF